MDKLHHKTAEKILFLPSLKSLMLPFAKMTNETSEKCLSTSQTEANVKALKEKKRAVLRVFHSHEKKSTCH